MSTYKNIISKLIKLIYICNIADNCRRKPSCSGVARSWRSGGRSWDTFVGKLMLMRMPEFVAMFLPRTSPGRASPKANWNHEDEEHFTSYLNSYMCVCLPNWKYPSLNNIHCFGNYAIWTGLGLGRLKTRTFLNKKICTEYPNQHDDVIFIFCFERIWKKVIDSS